MVIEIFIAQRQSHHPLLDQRFQRMLYLGLVPMIHKTAGQPLQNMRTLFDFAQQQPATV